MSKTISKHIEEFKVGANANFGFAFALYRLLTAVPAGFGHIIDSIYDLNGMFSKKKDENMSGPFGFIFGLPFALIGLIIGSALQIIFSLTGYVGYIIDRLISSIVSLFRAFVFHKAMTPEVGIEILCIMNSIFTGLFYRLPVQMEGPFGFFLGLIPEIARGICIKILAIPTAIINSFTGAISEVFSSINEAISEDEEFGEDEEFLLSETPESATTEDTAPKKRIKFSANTKESIDYKATIAEIVKAKINLFSIFAIPVNKPEDAKSVYRKLGLVFSPDKFDIFNEVVNDALAKQPTDILENTILKKNNMTAQTFLSLAQIDRRNLSDKELKQKQEQTFVKLKTYSHILSTPALRKSYMEGMGIPVPPANDSAGIAERLGGKDSATSSERLGRQDSATIADRLGRKAPSSERQPANDSGAPPTSTAAAAPKQGRSGNRVKFNRAPATAAGPQ